MHILDDRWNSGRGVLPEDREELTIADLVIDDLSGD
jgi:hypothetical protein